MFSKMPLDPGKVWVTRTAPFNGLTAKHLAARGYKCGLFPALRVVSLERRRPFAVPHALVFTSLNGIRLHHFSPALADLPTFVVGDHSARYARAVGYRRVFSASGNVVDLARTIIQRSAAGNVVLHMSAARCAGNLPEMLAAGGVTLQRMPVYDAVESSFADLPFSIQDADSPGRIMIHSPRAGEHVAGWMMREHREWDGEIIAISKAAASPFGNLQRAHVTVASRPNEPEMLSCLDSGRGAQTWKNLSASFWARRNIF